MNKSKLKTKMKLTRTNKKPKTLNEAPPVAASKSPPTPAPTAKPAPVVTPSKPVILKVPSVTPQTEAVATKARPVPPEPCASSITTIEARVNVGFGNHLFLRGQGAGLSWERGTPLKCVDAQTWRWSAPAAEPLTFKLLLNDTKWAQGDDVIAAPGSRLEVAPRF